MIDFESKISKLEAEVAAIKEKVSFFSVIYEKFDKTLEKLDERQNEDRKDLQLMIDDLRNDIMQEMKAFREEAAAQHQSQQKKIEELNKWRWVVVGGAAVAGWLISKLGLPFELK